MRIAPLVFTIVMCALGYFARADQQANVSLDGEWEFTYTGTSTAEVPALPPASAYDAQISVPGQWDDQLDRFKQTRWWPQAVFSSSLGPVQYLSGIGWHRRTIDVPADWSGRATTLTVGGAVGKTMVWINGVHAGTYKYGVYTPYLLDLTGKLKPGKQNEIIIAVDNAAPNEFGSWAFLGNPGKASGLARSVSIQVAPGPGRIADLYVQPGADLKEVVWKLDLTRPNSDEQVGPSKIEWSVRDAKDGRELGRGQASAKAFSKSSQVTWNSRFQDIKPWSDREPNLYVTEIRWVGPDGKVWDTRTQRFGLRRWSYEGRKLFLNGEPHYLRLEFGAYYFPIHATTPMSKEYWLRHMKRVKELGLNGINFAARVSPIEMLEAADEVGVIIQCGDEVTTREVGKAEYKEVWEDIVRTTRPHPSMCIYGFGGELKYYDGVIEQNKRQRELILSLHPESLVMPQQAIHGIDYGIEDPTDKDVKRTPFLHHAGRLARYTEACDLFGHYSGGAFSHAYFGTPWRAMEERFEIYEKPLVAHELFISASYLDPDDMKKYTGRIPPYIYTRLQQDLEAAGLTDKWRTYVDVTSRLQHICRKYCMEKARKCDGLAGFELLGMTDMHFITPEYAVGIVDEFLEMKPGDTVEGVRRYSNESVLLLDFDGGMSINRCYWEGETFEADVMVSLYGPQPIESGKLSWVLKRGTEVVGQGTEQLTDVPHGKVSTLKQLQVTWPQVERTERLNLSVTLEGSGYKLANDWDFWVFAKQAPPKVAAAVERRWRKVLERRYEGMVPPVEDTTEKLRIVSELTEREIAHLAQGGDVVLLGTAPFTAYDKWRSFYPAKGYRPFSNGGTVLAEHPIFAGHPHEGWGDWHFYPLMDGANCVLFDGTIDMAFDPIMEIVSSAGHVRKQALIFEKRVGTGRLLVATTAMDMKNPSCVTLMDSIFRYVQSDEFSPQDEIAPGQLLARLSSSDASGNWLTDPGFEKAGHWMTEGGMHEFDTTTARSGNRSLKLSVSDADLRENVHFSSGVSIPRIIYSPRPQRLKLSAWFKADLATSGVGPKVMVTFRYKDAHIRSSNLSISLPKSSQEWQYVEKVIDLEGEMSQANIMIDLTGVAGKAWIDDVYFGLPEEGENSESSGATPGGATATHWSNRAVTRKFNTPLWYRINQGEWRRGSEVALDQEGVHTLFTKTTEADNEPDRETISIDLTPPLVTLEMDPDLEQQAGVFTTDANTIYSFKASDALSGAKLIEYSTDGKTYHTYSKPFKLPPGRHVITSRATDMAGNQSKEMSGEWITGADEESLEVEVAPVPE